MSSIELDDMKEWDTSVYSLKEWDNDLSQSLSHCNLQLSIQILGLWILVTVLLELDCLY